MLFKFAFVAVASANRGAMETESTIDSLLNSQIEFTSKNMNMDGGCTEEDKAAVLAAGPGTSKNKKSIPGMLDKCGREAYNFWKNSFDGKAFHSCLLKSNLKVSRGCGKCLAIGPEFGAANCKSACMSNSCAVKCKKCTAPAGPKIVTCAGFKTPEMICK